MQGWTANCIGALIILGSVLVWIGAVHPHPSVLAQQGNDSGGLRELAERLAAVPFVTVGTVQPVTSAPSRTDTPTAELLVGQITSALPVGFAVPPGGRTVGSAVRRLGSEIVSVEVVLDAPGTAADLVAFYQRDLERQGWSVPSTPAGGGGFVPSLSFSPTPGYTAASFCRSATDPWVQVVTAPLQGTTHDVRVRAQLSGPGPCAPPAPPAPVGGPPFSNRLPTLSAPAGVTLMPSGGGGSANSWTSNAILETELDSPRLETHFADQLQTAGWARQGSGGDGAFAWSTWTVPGDDAAQGALLVFAWPGQNRRFATVRVETPAAAAGGSGSVWYGPGPAPTPALSPPR